jgi:histone H4
MRQGGVIRHRRVLRDTIEGITRPALIRLVRTASIGRINGAVYSELRALFKLYTENIVRSSIIITEYAGRKTMKANDVIFAVEST